MTLSDFHHTTQRSDRRRDLTLAPPLLPPVAAVAASHPVWRPTAGRFAVGHDTKERNHHVHAADDIELAIFGNGEYRRLRSALSDGCRSQADEGRMGQRRMPRDRRLLRRRRRRRRLRRRGWASSPPTIATKLPCGAVWRDAVRTRLRRQPKRPAPFGYQDNEDLPLNILERKAGGRHIEDVDRPCNSMMLSVFRSAHRRRPSICPSVCH
jgi:hypothetical protein